MEIQIKGEYIELNKLLKIADLVPTGGAAGIVIAEELVTVDGATETRKRCKIRPGQTVSYDGETVTVIGNE